MFLSTHEYEHLLNGLSEKARDVVVNTSFDQMVSDLAKPGEQIRDQLTVHGFDALGLVCVDLINAGNRLDLVKKQVVYNKAVSINEATVVTLPLSVMPAFSKLTGEQAHMLHMAIGLAGEAAEMLEQVFNHVFHGKPLDGENVREEAGDATFYTVGLLHGIETPLEEAMFANKAKLLGKRYPDGYSDQAAQVRADKEPGQ